MINKKGIMLSQAFGAVLTLVLIAILVIIAIFLFTTLGTSMLATGTVGSAVNESIAKPTTAGINLSVNSLTSGSCGAITAIFNGTGGVAIALGNITQTRCLVQNATDVSSYGATWLVSYPYTYSASTVSSNASTTMITQFATFPALVGLVGTIIFLALVIGVLVASFAFGSKKGV